MSPTPLAPGFMIIHGNQPELLRQLLVHWFKAQPLAPLEDERILVQSNGIAQWLKLALAAHATDAAGGGCGIAAAVDMLLPSRFVWQAYRAVLGDAAVPEASPFDKPLLLWRLMRLLPEQVHEPGFEPLARFLADDSDLRRRYQLAEKIADLFDQYQVYRADWLDAWSQGQDTLPNLHGETPVLEAGQRWQALLWRALLADVSAASQTSRAAVHRHFLEVCRQLPERPAALPRRVAVFGISSLPRQSLEVLQQIARFTQVILCVHNPCEHYWADLLSAKDHARRQSGRFQRKAGMPPELSEAALHLHAHPLLAAWGKQGRDYISLLDALDEPERYRASFARQGERIDLFESHGDTCLLHQLQDDIRLLRSVRESQETWGPVDPEQDRSLRFHIAHSPQREVEILHDQLLAAFNADASLRPRDIIVMVPDVNQYAPHIEAVFGQLGTHEPRHIPYSIADQASRQQAPLLFALEFLLHLPDSRLAVSDLLDLLDVAAVRQRFGIATGDLPVLRQWVEQTQIRWGLDARHRARFVPGTGAQNTWMQGLRRMLLGYAVGHAPDRLEDAAWHDIEPYGEVGGLDAALAGPLAQLLATLEALCDILQQATTPQEWVTRLQTLLRDFFASDAAEDDLLLLQLEQILQDWLEACQAAGLNSGASATLPLAVVREHWLAQVEPEALSRRFMAGRLTFATLMPMRAIPFRIVCLLGMNDGEFPRIRPPLDFDLMARDLRPGDRSRRDDDRYLFLEALLSARERLHISWVGRSIQDNSERPPSVLVSQLRDHLAACWRHVRADDLLAALTVEHRLQAFHPAYFGHNPGQSPWFTYAREWERRTATPVSTGSSTALLSAQIPGTPLSLGTLTHFLKNPVRCFFQDRLRIFLGRSDLSSEDQEPFFLDGLAQWALQDQLITARLEALRRAADEEQAQALALTRIKRTGHLPLGSSAALLAETLTEPLAAMFADYRAALARWPHALPPQRCHFAHASGTRIEGRIDLIQAAPGNNGERCRIALISSNLIKERRYDRPKLLEAWVLHLAAHLGGEPMRSCLIGKNGQVQLAPLDPETARAHFEQLIDHYLQALREPLPLAPKAGMAWLEKQGGVCAGELEASPAEARKAALGQYESSYLYVGEADQCPYLQRTYPDFASLWSEGRFSTLCTTLYGPLVAAIDIKSDTNSNPSKVPTS